MPALRPPELVEPLSGRFQGLPIVLAGPVLRCVRPDSVTVWIALREPKRVKLDVFALSSLTPLFSSPFRSTVAIGDHLHVLALQARASSSVLAPGNIYTYGLQFQSVSAATPAHGDLYTKGFLVSGNFSDGQSSDAAALVSYGGFGTPSFSLPPSSLTDLNIVHASCRKPHAPSVDALRVVDQLLAEAPGEEVAAAPARDPLKRPHQLFLTGDQIYADDVSSVLLALVMDAAPTLLGAAEKLPRLRVDGADGFATEFGPFTRKRVVRRVGYTTTAENHLMAFGEYCAMYLLTLSDVLWPATLPTHAEVFPGQPASPPSRNVDTWSSAHYKQQLPPVASFRRSLARVRRALANVPTYMIFDDHDVTDDWFINRYFCSVVLKDDNVLGRRLIQNALMAYAIFQAWGNTPESLDETTGFLPVLTGQTLLKSLEAWGRLDRFATGGLNFENVGAAIGMPTALSPGSDDQVLEGTKQALFRSDDSLRWDFHQQWPNFEILVLDSRTQRSYQKGDATSPAHISEEALVRQIPSTIAAGDALTIVICPQPLVMMPVVQFFQEGVESLQKSLENEIEVWRFDPVAYEALLSRLASRGNGQRRAVFLSGDVHHAYAWKLQYWTRELGTNREISLAGGNMIASAAKNQDAKTEALHHAGFVSLVPSHTRRGTRLSWRLTPDEMAASPRVKRVAQSVVFGRRIEAPHKQTLAVIENAQLLIDAEPSIAFTPPPDTIERREHVASVVRSAPVQRIDQPGVNVQERLTNTLRALGYYGTAFFNNLAPGQQIVGTNNLGRLRFEWGVGDAKAVTQELWWFKEDTATLYAEEPASPKRAERLTILRVPLALSPRPQR